MKGAPIASVFAAVIVALATASVADAHRLNVKRAKYWTWVASVAVADELNYTNGWDFLPYRSTDCRRTSAHRIVCDGNVAGTAYFDDGTSAWADCYFPVAVKFASRRSRQVVVTANPDGVVCYDADGNSVSKRSAQRRAGAAALRRAVAGAIR